MAVLPRRGTESPVSDEALVNAARGGDLGASQALFLRHHRMTRTLVVRLLGRSGEIDDLVQDAFLEALRGLPRLRNGQAFQSWLCRITVMTVRHHLRKLRLLRRFGLHTTERLAGEGLVSPDAPPEVVADMRRLYAALDLLPARTRIAFVMRHLEGRKLEEIAELLDGSLSSVKRWVTQAEDHVRRKAGLRTVGGEP